MLRFPTVMIAAVLLSTVAMANPKVGQEAPGVTATWVANAPENDVISELKGEVIFLEYWGVK